MDRERARIELYPSLAVVSADYSTANFPLQNLKQGCFLADVAMTVVFLFQYLFYVLALMQRNSGIKKQTENVI